jgi:hypothetical protein
MKRGGDLNIDALAKRFHVDVDMLRQMVAESKRRRAAETGDGTSEPGTLAGMGPDPKPRREAETAADETE